MTQLLAYVHNRRKSILVATVLLSSLLLTNHYINKYISAIKPRVIALGNFPVFVAQKEFSPEFLTNFKYDNKITFEDEGTASDRQKYIQRFSKVAKDEMRHYGIPASITLAQGILESASGGSKLALATHNHFGMKCMNKACKKGKNPGHCKQYWDDHPNDRFIVFESPWWSYRRHSKLLTEGRYRYLLDDTPSTYGRVNPISNPTNDEVEKWELAVKNWNTPYKRWAYGLDALGYATSNKYAKKLIKLIEAENLNQYDCQHASISK